MAIHVDALPGIVMLRPSPVSSLPTTPQWYSQEQQEQQERGNGAMSAVKLLS